VASDRERLQKLLPHWIEHNAEHAGEFREWAAKVRALSAGDAADDVVHAAEAMEQANKYLQSALGKLGSGE